MKTIVRVKSFVKENKEIILTATVAAATSAIVVTIAIPRKPPAIEYVKTTPQGDLIVHVTGMKNSILIPKENF